MQNTSTNKYFDCLSEYHEFYNRNDNSRKLILLHINARSCASMDKFDDLKALIDSCVNEIDIIVVSETWFKHDQLCLYNLNGYTAVHGCRRNRSGGGISVYIKNPCAISNVDVFDGDWNSLKIQIRNYKGIPMLSLLGVYRPHVTQS